MKKALLIIDVQNDYFDNGAYPLSNANMAAKNIQGVLGKFRAEEDLVVFIKHINMKESATFFKPKTLGSEIYKAIEPIEGETVIIKHTPNSFRDTELHQFLRLQKIEELVIVGMMTQHCVDTTVRAAYDLGYSNILLYDCCATKDLVFSGEAIAANIVQSTFMAALSRGFSDVMSSTEYLRKIK
ncbi:cysteine hydrolase family protein [Sedimentibacter sp.]|uniref:cysteine hydrolase family protein n=1 Tax=Sedimentibacter sp. TaxID=1960295 RepID=UPI0028ACB268|nr:cysteine hydrolase family protein [Sedimentibacter sp.]